MPKQQFEILDYAGPLFVGAAFALIVFFLTFVINFAFIRRSDEVTAFEKVSQVVPDVWTQLFLARREIQPPCWAA